FTHLKTALSLFHFPKDQTVAGNAIVDHLPARFCKRLFDFRLLSGLAIKRYATAAAGATDFCSFSAMLFCKLDQLINEVRRNARRQFSTAGPLFGENCPDLIEFFCR